MMFVFEGPNNILYSNPDIYILSRPQKTIFWGDKLNIYPVYCRGSVPYHGHQVIKAMFYHEGNSSGPGSTYWVTDTKNSIDWYVTITDANSKIKEVDLGRIVLFDLGNNHPKYFRSKEDLSWYISNIYNLSYINIVDGLSLGDTY